jgi:hypothetical protein
MTTLLATAALALGLTARAAGPAAAAKTVRVGDNWSARRT